MKAIKSVLANRKMFRGGGLVPSRNEMVDLNAPSGILSSSMPLIEAVESDALSAEGGTALMSQGGVARFASGGSNTDALQDIARVRQARVAYESGRISRADLNAVMDAVLQKHGGVRNLYAKLSPEQKEDPVVQEVAFQLRPAPEAPDAPIPAPPSSEGLLPLDVSAAPKFDPSAAVPLDIRVGLNPNVSPELQSYLAKSGMRPVLERQIANMPQQVAPPPVDQPAVLTPIGPAPQIIAPEIQDAPSAMFEGDIAPNQGIVSAVVPPELQREETRPSGFVPPSATISEDLMAEKPEPVIGEADDPEGLTVEEVLASDPYLSAKKEGAWTSPLIEGASLEDVLSGLGEGVIDKKASQVLPVEEPSAGEKAVEEYGPGGEFYDTPFPGEVEDTTRQDVVIESATEPEVATQTNPRSDGSPVAENLVVPNEALLSAALSGQNLRAVPVPSTSGEPKTVTRDTLYSALRSDGANADEDIQNAGIDDITKRLFEMANPASGTQSVPTMEELKRDIEAALPTIKEDESMAGLHTILLGAAIAGGTSSNPWTNIANGVAQQLPNIIAYKGKMAEAKRERQMAVAKLAINQKLGLEAEGRAEIRDMRKFAREELSVMSKEKRAEALAMRTPEDYMYVQDTMVPAKLFDENAEKGQMLLIPQHTVIPLTPTEMKRAVDLGLTKNLVLHKNVDPDDLVPPSTAMDSTDVKNMYHTPQQMTIFKDFYPGGEGFTYNVALPTEWGTQNGRTKYKILEADITAVNNAFRSVSGKLGTINEKLNNLSSYAETGNLVGVDAWKQGMGDKFRTFEGQLPFAKEMADALLGGADISDMSKFEAEGRLVLAEITPMLLGESGRTISDADRIRVARALGYTIDTDPNGNLSIGQFVGGTLKTTAGIQHALNTVKSAIQNSYTMMQNEYRDKMSQVDYIIPTTMESSLAPLEQAPNFDFDATT
jgi:hypothetical protein